MKTFAKFFSGTTGVMLAITLCGVCLLLSIGAFCILSGGTIISIIPTATP